MTKLNIGVTTIDKLPNNTCMKLKKNSTNVPDFDQTHRYVSELNYTILDHIPSHLLKLRL